MSTLLIRLAMLHGATDNLGNHLLAHILREDDVKLTDRDKDDLHRKIGKFIAARRMMYEAGDLSEAVVSSYAEKFADELRGGPKHEVRADEH